MRTAYIIGVYKGQGLFILHAHLSQGRVELPGFSPPSTDYSGSERGRVSDTYPGVNKKYLQLGSSVSPSSVFFFRSLVLKGTPSLCVCQPHYPSAIRYFTTAITTHQPFRSLKPLLQEQKEHHLDPSLVAICTSVVLLALDSSYLRFCRCQFLFLV